MKKIITLAVAFAIIASPAFAAKKTTTTTTTTTSSSPTYSNSSSSSYEPILSIDLGLGSALKKFHFGPGFHFELPYSIEGNRFRFGGQTGFYFGPSDADTWIIPILLTAVYDIPVSRGPIKPFIGVGIGASIAHVSFLGLSNTSTDFAFQFNPGITFGDRDELYFQVPFGTMGDTFFILPAVGMRF